MWSRYATTHAHLHAHVYHACAKCKALSQFPQSVQASVDNFDITHSTLSILDSILTSLWTLFPWLRKQQPFLPSSCSSWLGLQNRFRLVEHASSSCADERQTSEEPFSWNEYIHPDLNSEWSFMPEGYYPQDFISFFFFFSSLKKTSFLSYPLSLSPSSIHSKTLFNIVEAPFNNKNWTLMSVLYDDIQMDQ